MCIHSGDNTNCELCDLNANNEVHIPNRGNNIVKDIKEIKEESIEQKERRLRISEAYCKHNILRKNCEECNIPEMCKHNKIKHKCKECIYPCRVLFCEGRGNIKHDNYCNVCYKKLFKALPNPNRKRKEKNVVKEVMEKFPNFTWKTDKRIEGGYSKKRPDLLCDFGSHVMIIEIDEYSHRKYNNFLEHKRTMELSKDISHRPIVLIRFNPDDYTNEKGIYITSCWKKNKKTKTTEIKKTKENEWKKRIELLFNTIQYWSTTQTTKTIEIIELFCDKK